MQHDGDWRRVSSVYKDFAVKDGVAVIKRPALQEKPFPEPVSVALGLVHSMFASKNADYSRGAWDSAFQDVAVQLGTDSRDVVETLIAVKQARLKSLRGKVAVNESVKDTILDRAVYSVIALALYIQEEANG